MNEVKSQSLNQELVDDSWVPWFRELAIKINENDQEFLVQHIQAVDWSEAEDTGGMAKYGDRYIDRLAEFMAYAVNDPFSFFYFLASKTNSNSMHDIFQSVHETFNLSADCPTTGKFMPNPRRALLFQDVMGGKVDRESHDLLWNLFRQAAPENPEICPETFNQVLNMWFIYPLKLTECLFLINPGKFFPIEDKLLIPIYSGVEQEWKSLKPKTFHCEELIEEGGYEKYQELLDDIRANYFDGEMEMYDIYAGVCL